jgi:hypothetical protein
MTSLIVTLLVIFVAFAVLLAVLGRLRRQVGGGLGPTELSDGSMTTTPTGYPEEMKGGGKKIGPTDNNAAGM